MQGDAVQNRAHGVLTDAEVKHATILVAVHSWVDHSAGTNDFAPLMVVRFDSARSAEPPQSSGITEAIG